MHYDLPNYCYTGKGRGWEGLGGPGRGYGDGRDHIEPQRAEKTYRERNLSLLLNERMFPTVVGCRAIHSLPGTEMGSESNNPFSPLPPSSFSDLPWLAILLSKMFLISVPAFCCPQPLALVQLSPGLLPRLPFVLFASSTLLPRVPSTCIFPQSLPPSFIVSPCVMKPFTTHQALLILSTSSLAIHT